jgi:hypothetical protein
MALYFLTLAATGGVTSNRLDTSYLLDLHQESSKGHFTSASVHPVEAAIAGGALR